MKVCFGILPVPINSLVFPDPSVLDYLVDNDGNLAVDNNGSYFITDYEG